MPWRRSFAPSLPEPPRRCIHRRRSRNLGGGRVATAGELYLLPGELDVVVRTLDEHGLHVSALHNQMLDDGPPHFWVHWYATGDETTLARGVAATLAHMNSAQKAVAEP